MQPSVQPNGWPYRTQEIKPPLTVNTQQRAAIGYREWALYCWKLILAVLMLLMPLQTIAFYRMVKDLPRNKECDSLYHDRLERIQRIRDSFHP